MGEYSYICDKEFLWYSHFFNLPESWTSCNEFIGNLIKATLYQLHCRKLLIPNDKYFVSFQLIKQNCLFSTFFSVLSSISHMILAPHFCYLIFLLQKHYDVSLAFTLSPKYNIFSVVDSEKKDLTISIWSKSPSICITWLPPSTSAHVIKVTVEQSLCRLTQIRSMSTWCTGKLFLLTFSLFSFFSHSVYNLKSFSSATLLNISFKCSLW